MIVAVTSDLFLQSRITELANSLGVATRFTSDSADLKGRLTPDTVLVVLDLSATDYDPFAVALDLKRSWPSLRLLGFFPHIKADLKRRGEKSGIDVIVSNSKFMTALRKLLAEEVHP